MTRSSGLTLLLALAIVSPTVQDLSARQIIEHYEPVPGFLKIGPEASRAIPMTERGHTLILPDGSPQGVLVLPDSRPFRSQDFELQPGELDTEALNRGVAILHITTGNPLDFLFEENEVKNLAGRISNVLKSNGLADAPCFFAGLSLGGTRALRLAEFLAGSENPAFRPAAVAVVDSPIDMIRFYAAEKRAAGVSFHPAAQDEGRWVTYLLETHLGGGPYEARDSYVRYSPFTFGEEGGGNAVHLRTIPLRAYHEPDVNWWIENRRKSYYSMNSVDLAGLVNELLLLGNERATLITTHQQRVGFEEGSSPHTWSIVDNGELIDWFLAQN